MPHKYGCEDCGALFYAIDEIPARCLGYVAPIVEDDESVSGYVLDTDGDTLDAVAEAIARRLDR